MAKRKEMKFWLKTNKPKRTELNYNNIWINSGLLLLIIYFAYHSLSGQRGVFAYLRLNKEIIEREKEYIQVLETKETLEKHVKILYDGNLDLDYLDEIAREQQGLIAADEKVVLLKK
jgi:cell division protein FtsB